MSARHGGRVALITGASRGIGRAVALRLAADGADIAINYHSDRASAESAAAQVAALGRSARVYQASVADPRALTCMLDAVVCDFGRLDILVNNGGTGGAVGPVADADPAEVERLLRLHALGPFRLTQLALPHLRRQPRSDVIMISSLATRLLAPNIAPYTMAKCAMEALAVCLAREEAPHGLRVNVVAPGMTLTDMGREAIRKTAPGRMLEDLGRDLPLGRVCSPEEVAAVVSFLASPENGYATGQRIYLDGGV